MSSPSPVRSTPVLRRLLCRTFWTVSFLSLGSGLGCRDDDVVAQVGRAELRQADVEAYAAQHAVNSDTRDGHLEALIDRTRLAEQASASGLDKRPDILAQLAASRREVLAQALLQQELKHVTDEAALRRRYDDVKSTLARRQVHVRHIIIRWSDNATEAERRGARDRANMLYARILGGESFEAVARETSQDEASAARGGELGIIREGQVHSMFFEAAAALKQDELSRPFETPYGIHVVQALAAVESVVPSFEEAKGRLGADARREAESRLKKDLEVKIPVKRFPDALGAPDAGVPSSGASKEEET